MNNVGKTALLEALFLHIGSNNPELPLRVHVFRGINQFALEAEEIWGWLFFDKQTDKAIELVSLNEEDVERSAQISLIESETPKSIPAMNGGSSEGEIIGSLTTSAGTHDLVLEYRDTLGNSETSRAFISPEGEIKFKRTRLTTPSPGFFLSTRARFPKEDAERFSKLDAVGRQDEVLSTLKILEPRLKRLAVLVRGGTPIINGDIGIGELVPLPLMGEGIVRLASIVLAIANAPGGIILIDEIENGLHYSVMVDIWKAIAVAARRSDTQVFATTHSWECIQAAHEAFLQSDNYDFGLYRLDRINNEVKPVTYNQKTLATAIATDLEVR
jgi:hypothetical protein